MSQNNTFNPLDWTNTSAKPCMASANSQSDFEELLQAIESSRTDITGSYDDWFRCGTAIAHQFGESGRPYFHRISQFHPSYRHDDTDRKYNDCLRDTNPQVNIGTIFHLAKQAGIVLRSEHSQGDYAQPVQSPDKPRKEKKSKVNKLVAVRSYLCANFSNGADLRHDLLSRKIQFLKDGHWQDLSDKDINSITCAIAAAADANITPAEVHTVLNSDLVPDIHPLRDWLDHLPEFTPEEGKRSPIEALASQVQIVGNQYLWLTCFRKWFVAMVASWLKDDIVNQQVLVLISEQQGKYKTTWLDHLIPPELRAYQSKLASARELNKDERIRTAEFALINMDEIDSMTTRELNVLKSVITSADVNERAAYGRVKERRIRCASFCASGNNRKFLSDETGNRRWLPFEVDSIEDPWFRTEPWEDIYAEAVYLFRSGFEYWFSKEETLAMADHTDEFRAQTSEEELLPLYFSPADKDTEGAVALSTAEIHQKLIDYGRILHPMALNKFGSLLQKKGFVRRSVSGGSKAYLVVSRDLNAVHDLHKAEASELQQQLRDEEAYHRYLDAVAPAPPVDAALPSFSPLDEVDSRQQDNELPF